ILGTQSACLIANSALTFYLTGYELSSRLRESYRNITAIESKLSHELSQESIHEVCNELVKIYCDIQHTNLLWKYINGVQYAFLYATVTSSLYLLLFMESSVVVKLVFTMCTCISVFSFVFLIYAVD